MTKMDVVDLTGDQPETPQQRIEQAYADFRRSHALLAERFNTIQGLLTEALHVHDGQLTEAPPAAVRRLVQAALDVARGDR
jgi:hypothetical protein